MKKYFGTDGIRGKVGEFPITPDFILKLGWAAGQVFAKDDSHTVLIGKDTRSSGYMFESVLEAGLSAAGVHTKMLGPMPTPGIAYLTRTFRAQAGIVISASHNPYYDNGIKFFSAQGVKLPDELELEIEKQLECPMTTVDSSRLGKVGRLEDARGRYIEFCKSTIPSRMDFSGLTIVVDCANGATYDIAPHVFREIGANIIPLAVSPDGLNINDGCGATSLEKLQQAIVVEKADLGIALDGDGDRVMMVDHLGDVVDGDELLFIIAKSRLRSDELRGPVIGTLMSNLGLEHALSRQGVELKRANVGDRYVMEMLREFNSVLGGESSGHIICTDRTTTGDGIVSALQVLAEMWQTEKSLGELKAEMEKYPQTLINVSVNNKPDLEAFEPIQKVKREVENQLSNTGRVLLRPSGTEPLIRVMVEGQDGDLVKALAEKLADTVAEELA